MRILDVEMYLFLTLLMCTNYVSFSFQLLICYWMVIRWFYSMGLPLGATTGRKLSRDVLMSLRPLHLLLPDFSSI